MANDERQPEDRDWRPIPGHPGYHAAANGQIRGPQGQPLQPSRTSPTGYAKVSVGDRRLDVHRLVCLAFHGPPPPGCRDAMHLDGDASHNCAANLAWGSRSANVRAAVAADPQRFGRRRFSDDQARAIWRGYHEQGLSLRALLGLWGGSYRTLAKLVHGQSYRAALAELLDAAGDDRREDAA